MTTQEQPDTRHNMSDAAVWVFIGVIVAIGAWFASGYFIFGGC